MGLTKTCVTCKETKELSQFGKLKASKDGFDTKCKPCTRSYHKKHLSGIRLCVDCKLDKKSSEFNKNSSLCKLCETNKLELAKNNLQKCIECKEIKSFSEYSKSRSNSVGIYSTCKNCRKKKLNTLSCSQARIKVSTSCRICGGETFVSKVHLQRTKKAGTGCLCKNCHQSLRSEYGKKARACVKNPALSVAKQWETIKANPILYAKMQAQRSRTSKEIWATSSEEKKNYRIQQLTAKISRSKGSDALKDLLIYNNLYEGFISEEPFHGFIPDEINHELKIIIEYFGDLYHCNPRKYTDTTQFISAIQRTVGEQWLRDRLKLAAYYRNGYTVIVVWESDFHKQPSVQIERIKIEIEKKKNEIIKENLSPTNIPTI